MLRQHALAARAAAVAGRCHSSPCRQRCLDLRGTPRQTCRHHPTSRQQYTLRQPALSMCRRRLCRCSQCLQPDAAGVLRPAVPRPLRLQFVLLRAKTALACVSAACVIPPMCRRFPLPRNRRRCRRLRQLSPSVEPMLVEVVARWALVWLVTCRLHLMAQPPDTAYAVLDHPLLRSTPRPTCHSAPAECLPATSRGRLQTMRLQQLQCVQRRRSRHRQTTT